MNETVAKKLAALHQGKDQLRSRRRSLSLAEKVEQVVELQRAILPLIRRRRDLKPWERVWNLDTPSPHPRQSSC